MPVATEGGAVVRAAHRVLGMGAVTIAAGSRAVCRAGASGLALLADPVAAKNLFVLVGIHLEVRFLVPLGVRFPVPVCIDIAVCAGIGILVSVDIEVSIAVGVSISVGVQFPIGVQNIRTSMRSHRQRTPSHHSYGGYQNNYQSGHASPPFLRLFLSKNGYWETQVNNAPLLDNC